ncbi:MAG: RHS repeat-associated core domain-containing protein [Bacteroidota bacterium]|nr:RHS repeat-associated core domain-containing protein [Bacteroidota bacterium]
MFSYQKYLHFCPSVCSAWDKGYRYGFNGKEIDKGSEGMGGGGSTYDYGFRIYNPSLGKFLSVDPLFKGFPWNSSYCYAENIPIAFIDIDGLERYFAADGSYLGQQGTSNEIRVVDAKEIYENNMSNSSALYKASKKLSETSDKINSNVYTTIYKREIRGTDKKIDVQHTTSDQGGQTNPDNGDILINKDVENGLINNYWDLVSLLYHEEGHRKKGLVDGDKDFGNDFWEHEKITYSVMKNKELWSKLSGNCKKFHLDVYRKNYLKAAQTTLATIARKYTETGGTIDQLKNDPKYKEALKVYNTIKSKYEAAGGETPAEMKWSAEKFFEDAKKTEPVKY